jgi:alkylation response protein AidB-like acyl-CoA dehydrogenase
VQSEVLPLVPEAEERHEFPPGLFKRLGEQGLLGLKYPSSEGGQGGDMLADCVFVEELTRAAAGISASVFAHLHLAIAPLVYFADAGLRDRYARPAMRGELVGGFALTEPGAGSDARAITTRATRTDGGYVINGSKVFTTNGTIADYLLVAAAVDSGDDRRIAVFVVDTDSPGVERRRMRKLGNWSSDTAEVFLSDVEVPAENRVGGEAGGFHQLRRTLTEGRVIVATRPLALAERAYEIARGYAQARSAFGRTIGSFQAVSHPLAQMAVELDAARLLITRAAWLTSSGSAEAPMAASKAKYFASTLAQRVTTEALHLLGGAGYTPEHEVERLYRDAPEAVIGEGTAQIQLEIIARAIGLGERP